MNKRPIHTPRVVVQAPPPASALFQIRDRINEWDRGCSATAAAPTRLLSVGRCRTLRHRGHASYYKTRSLCSPPTRRASPRPRTRRDTLAVEKRPPLRARPPVSLAAVHSSPAPDPCRPRPRRFHTPVRPPHWPGPLLLQSHPSPTRGCPRLFDHDRDAGAAVSLASSSSSSSKQPTTARSSLTTE